MLPGAGGNAESMTWYHFFLSQCGFCSLAAYGCVAVLSGKDSSITANPNAFVGEMTSSVYRALAHLSSLATSSSVHRKNFSRDVVACMLEDIWPDVQKVCDCHCVCLPVTVPVGSTISVYVGLR
jgi:hypothetical protein